MSAAATIAAAAAQKDMVWLKTGKIAKKPKLTDPLQLYSLAEVASTKGTGAEAILTCKVVDTFYDQPMNFLPQGGGYSEGEVVEVPRKETFSANPPHQDMEMDLGNWTTCTSRRCCTASGSGTAGRSGRRPRRA